MKGAAISWQLLTPSEESTLVDWCAHFALTAKPLNYHGVWVHADLDDGGNYYCQDISSGAGPSRLI